MPHSVWVLLMVMALAYGASSIIAEAGEVIQWIAGALFLVFVAGLVKKNSHSIRLSLVILNFIAIIPLVSTGGELVYQYSAANSHLPEKKQE